MDITPGPVTAWGLGLAVAHPAMLVALSHGPARVASAGRRYLVATGICLALWAAAAAGTASAGAAVDWSDIVAGALILCAALWAFGTLWTVICWGFTASLLQALARLGQPGDEDAWFREYTGGVGIETFVRDRLSLLTAAGLARECGESVVIATGRGRLLAACLRVLHRLYGLRND